MRVLQNLRDRYHRVVKFGGNSLVGTLERQPEARKFEDVMMLGFVARHHPDSTQTLLTHSLEACLMGSAVAHKLKLGEEDRKIILATGFLHDIGYLAFRHITDEIDAKKHEKRSAEIVRGDFNLRCQGSGKIPRVLTEFGVDPDSVASLIEGIYSEKPYLQEIVSSPMDIDKIAYIKRDSFMAQYNCKRFDVCELIDCMSIKNSHLCVDERGVELVKKMGAIRNILHEVLYNYPFSGCENEMLQRALLRGGIELENFFKYGDKDFLRDVEEELKGKSEKNKESGIEIRYSPAVNLVRRLREKNPYACVLNVYSSSHDSAQNIETRLQRDAGLWFGDVIVKLPYNLKERQKKRSFKVNKAVGGGLRLQDVKIDEDYENRTKQEYGMDKLITRSIPFVSVFCDEANRQKVVDAAKDYFKLK